MIHAKHGRSYMRRIKDSQRSCGPSQSGLCQDHNYAVLTPTNDPANLCCGSTLFLKIEDELPASVDAGENGCDALLIDVGDMTADLDLTGWIPSGLNDGAIVSVRTVVASAYKIVLTDFAGVGYEFVNRVGEVISLVFVESENILRVI